MLGEEKTNLDTMDGSGFSSPYQSRFENNSLVSIIIPSSVTTIGQLAFNENDLENIKFEEGIIDIGSQAFANNNLTEVIIPTSVTSIGIYAFSNNKLTNVIIEGKTSTTDFTTYGLYPFGWGKGCNDTKCITWKGTS